MKLWTTVRMSGAVASFAPNGAEIAVGPAVAGASVVRAAFEPGRPSRAMRNARIDEVWIVLAGAGELWRAAGSDQEVTPLAPGVAATIPSGVDHQVRASGEEPLQVIVVSTPPWPGDDEAIAVDGHWRASDPASLTP